MTRRTLTGTGLVLVVGCAGATETKPVVVPPYTVEATAEPKGPSPQQELDGGAETTATAPAVEPSMPTPSPPPPPDVGTLFVNTLPPSNCVVNAQPRGHTPFTVTMPAGLASVTCLAKSGDQILKKSHSVVVKVGEKATVIMKLRDKEDDKAETM